jgi:predicted DNA-binding transcriptional regulator YafY
VLKEYRNRWYVTGKGDSSRNIITFALDRIVSISVLNELFSVDDEFNADQYFKYSFGISVSNQLKPEEIILAFSPQQGEYIKSQPLHHTQEVLSESPSEFLVKIKVIPSFELTSQLLGYGSTVRVLEPEWLRVEIALEAEKLFYLYH